MDRMGERHDEMWDEQDGFCSDLQRFPDGQAMRLKVRFGRDITDELSSLSCASGSAPTASAALPWGRWRAQTELGSRGRSG